MRSVRWRTAWLVGVIVVVLASEVSAAPRLRAELYGDFTKAVTVENGMPHYNFFEVKKKKKVRCREDTIFGILLKGSRFPRDQDTAKLTATWTHPEFPDPKTGEPVTETVQSWETHTYKGRVSLETVLWQFADPNQMVDGKWNIAVAYEGETLVETTIELYDCPDAS